MNKPISIVILAHNEVEIIETVISEFYNITGIPILINTSFNENEPVVNSPKHAIECFLRTNLDILVLGNYILKK